MQTTCIGGKGSQVVESTDRDVQLNVAETVNNS